MPLTSFPISVLPGRWFWKRVGYPDEHGYFSLGGWGRNSVIFMCDSGSWMDASYWNEGETLHQMTEI